MSPLVIGIIVVAAVVLLAIVLSGPSSPPARPDPPVYAGIYTEPPEHGQVPPDEVVVDDEEVVYKTCWSCGKDTMREWRGPWAEQFGQGTLIHQDVLQWECTNCGNSGFSV